MRPGKVILIAWAVGLCLLLLTALSLRAQSPIGLGPGKLVNSVTLGPSGTVYGDTEFCTAWLPSAAALPVTTGLPIICVSNDATDNLTVFQLDTLNWTGPTVHATLINHMT